jgi:hypothetical protein
MVRPFCHPDERGDLCLTLLVLDENLGLRGEIPPFVGMTE